MNTFSVKFKIGSMDVDVIVTTVIVTAFNHQKFKVELITGEPNPIRLERSDQGSWMVRDPGKRKISDREFQGLTNAIDSYLESTFDKN